MNAHADRRDAGRTGTSRSSSCGGFNARDLICVKELDDKFDQVPELRTTATERKKLAEEIQRAILENYYFVPVFRHAFVNAIGPRVAAQKWQDVFPTITTGYCLSVGGHQAAELRRQK